MRLRQRTLTVVGLTMLVFFALLFGGAAVALTARYTLAEDREAATAATRVSRGLDGEIARLRAAAVVWGARDRSYTFMETRDATVLGGYLTDAQLTLLDVNFVIFLDKDGREVLTRMVDLDLGVRVEVPDSVSKAIQTTSALRSPGDPRGSAAGLMELPGGVAIVGAHAVTSSDMYAPPNGTLVMGRYLDATTVEKMSDVIGLPLSVSPPLASAPPGASRAELPTDGGASRRAWWAPEGSPSVLAVTVPVEDIHGAPVLLMRTSVERDLRASLLSAIRWAGVSLFFMCVVATATVFGLVDRTVIRRLKLLARETRAIGRSGDSTRRVQRAASDEIGELADGINGMLASIEASEAELIRSRDDLEQRVERRTRELFLSDAQHKELIESMADAVFSVDLEGCVELVNERAVELLGRPQDDLLGVPFVDLMTRGSAAKISRYLDRAQHHSSAWTVEAHLRSPGRDPIPVELRAAPFRDPDGAVAGTQWIARDVTERQRFEQQLIYLATHDSLTSLANRRAFESALELELAEALRDGEQGAVVWLDLDDFKDVNDTLGHAAGDEALVLLSGVLSRNIRASNLLARVGGDEFAVLMPRVTREEAELAADRILTAITSYTCALNGRSVRFGASLGVVFFPERGSTVQEVLSAADAAMYRAKARGRSTVYVSALEEQPEQLHVSRMEWNARINMSLEEDGFVVHAQPIVDLRTHEVVRHELLIRMRGESGELYPPSDFLPIAERLGLITQIDKWLLREAVSLLEADPAGTGTIELNMSGKVFADRDMLKLVASEIERSGIDPRRLGFEITETAAIADMARAQWFIGSLKEFGCRFSLDDFGSGFSSFYYLKHLPVDCLKIDGSYVRGLASSEQDRCLVRGIREMCLGLGVEVLAECVENAEILEAVESLGLDYAQGYHLGRPVPLEESGLVGTAGT